MLTFYQHLTEKQKRLKNLKYSMSTLGEMASKKNGKRKKLIQNKCALVPKTNVIRKGEGATVAASHLPSPAGRFVGSSTGRTGSVLPWKPSPSAGKLH